MLSTHTEQYHIKAKEGETGGYCILPGDPGRCEKIAKFFDNPEFLIQNHLLFKLFSQMKNTKKIKNKKNTFPTRHNFPKFNFHLD